MSDVFRHNVMHFGRLLRAAGLPLSSARIADAIRVLSLVGLSSREDARRALSAVMVSRREDQDLFDRAFALFWRESPISQRPRNRDAAPEQEAMPLALAEPDGERQTGGSARPALAAYSAAAALRNKDFETMSAEELAQARAEIAKMSLDVAPLPARRFEAAPRGSRIDVRASLRASLRLGGAAIPLSLMRQRTRTPDIVALCDVSGSMARYARVLLYFLHVLGRQRVRVRSFAFATRLTDITRMMTGHDADAAIGRSLESIGDFSSGTRIGASLQAFNRLYARRVLGQGAIAILITDGLDQAAGDGLAEEAERLSLSCRRLIWLNPLLRYEKFEPKSLGIRAILPYVDEFRPVHNLNALADLAQALSGPSRDDWKPLVRSRAA